MNYKILPTSVVDIRPQGKRKSENHNTTSSRENYSPFPDEVAIMCVEYFLRDCKNIFDPFAGWGERSNVCNLYGKKYIGYDISDVAIKHAFDNYGVKNIKGDSLQMPIPKFDGLLTCPPYWNLEEYNSPDGLDRLKTWDEFLYKYHCLISRVFESAIPGATFCIMVCDWRDNGIYYDLEYQTSKIFENIGAIPFDKVIISRSKISKIKVMLPQAKRFGYTVKVHETLLVFKKPGNLEKVSCDMFDVLVQPTKTCVNNLETLFE